MDVRHVLAAALSTILITVSWPTPVMAAPVEFQPGAPGIGDPQYPLAGNGGYDVGHYHLEVRYQPATDLLHGHEIITATATQNLSRFNLDLIGLTVDAITVNGKRAAWTRDGDELVVTPATGLRNGLPFVVDVRYHGVPRTFSVTVPSPFPPIPEIQLDSRFIHTDDGAIAAGEPVSASTWYPVNDHPRDKATYAVWVTVPEGLTALSNGILLGSTTKDAWTTFRWLSTSPMASYVSTVAIGHWRVDQHLHDGRQTIIAVDSTLPPTLADDAVGRTDEVTDFLETLFGPYPFEANGAIVEHHDNLHFALETQTRPIYPSHYFDGLNRGVVVHELAHQWFGDSVSLRNWSDLWLNEGFATYAEWLWDEHDGSIPVREQFNMWYDMPVDDIIWSPPPYDPSLADPFTPSTYMRGAMTLHALRIRVGEAAFWRIMRTWATEHRHGNATTADFIALAKRVCGQDLDAFFAAWLSGSQKPPNPDPLPEPAVAARAAHVLPSWSELRHR